MPIPAKPRFRGTVSYMPAPGAVGVPCPEAEIRIFDNDIDGRDLLANITTNSLGRFNKQATKAWQDVVTIELPFAGRRQVPDVTDIPVLMMEVKDPETGKAISGPYPYVSDHIDTTIILPWASPIATITPALEIMNIQGTSITLTTPPEVIWETVKNLAEAGDNFGITLGPLFPGSHGVPFLGNTVDIEKFRDLVCQLSGIDVDSSILRPNPEPATLTAIIVIFFIVMVAGPLAIGLSVFVMTMGMAVLLALLLGYEVTVKQKADAPEGPGSVIVPLPLLDLEFTKP